VESRSIDHAHHAINPFRTLTETIELAKAVETANAMTDPKYALIIVTADHIHVFTIAGYPTRGKVIGNDAAGNPIHEPLPAADNRNRPPEFRCLAAHRSDVRSLW